MSAMNRWCKNQIASRRLFFSIVLLLVFSVLSGCYQARVHETIEDRNRVLGALPERANFFEAKQIVDIEQWKDDPGKIVNVYIINPVTGGLLIPPIQCKGVPTSSTESLEPNQGYSRRYIESTYGVGEGMGYYWQVPLDGEDVFTNELPGRDGTYGDPVHFRACMSVDNQYHDWSAYGMNVIVTSASYTFPEATIKRDFEAEARLLQAEEILKSGGCVNPVTLEEMECDK